MRDTPAALGWEGFSERLQSAVDLFGKLEYDLDRMHENPGDPYAAFDFFVTADHLPEWSKRGPKFRNTNPLLMLVFHLASGAKHFRATAAIHQSVKTVRSIGGGFQAGFQSPGFQGGGLLVEREATAEWPAGSISAISLADQVLKFWRSELDLEAG